LLMIAYWRLRRIAPEDLDDPTPRQSRVAMVLALLSAGIVAGLGLAAVRAVGAGGLAGEALVMALPDTGLGNPITAVLVIFRNLDTVLEMAVLLAAWLATRAVMGTEGAALPLPPKQDAPLVGALLAALTPLGVLVAIYLLKAGGQSPGGAFQAGALLAACGVLLLLAGRLKPAADCGAWERIALVSGTLAFSAVGLAMLALGAPLLAIPGLWAVYLIETAMMVSIAATLVLLFAGSAGLGREGRP
jgi:multisubunit Na+/H+ antiporter MnhB subunit